MRSLRALAALLLVAVAALPGAAQTMPSFDQAYQVRIGLGDIPTSDADRGEGWNVVEKIRSGNATTERAFSAKPEAGGSIALSVVPPAGLEGDAVAILFLPTGYEAEAAHPVATELPCTTGGCTIRVYEGSAASPFPSPLTFTLRPTATAAAPGDGFPWLHAAIAFVLGCIVWAVLVRQGMVQRRTRKQSVATAAHEEIAAREPAPVLEGKKRALLAALKDIELAHQNKEVDTATYDAVKAEFKRQAVTVMRALETVEGTKPQ